MANKKDNKNRIHIIGGKWRSRLLNFTETPALRPTPNRVRETLFNWLNPLLQDAVCLDLFSGSGALGFEALSRGAQRVTFVECSSILIQDLQRNANQLEATPQVSLLHQSIPNIQLPPQDLPFNLVFMDPPFHQDWIPTTIAWLDTQLCLAKPAYIYLEAESNLQPILPKHWKWMRSKIAGQVGYHLAIRQ